MAEPSAMLFTAFEPSGDALAAPLIAELRRRQPQRPIFALGGAKMEQAGATLLENTTHRAVMLTDVIGEAWTHRRRLARLKRWLAAHPLAALVPTDSPAANWAICKLIRKQQPQAKVIHLVAPQLWAWAPWRIGRLRRLSDHVLCLLPFEPDWFAQRSMPATFVGHPLFAPGSRTRTGVEQPDAPRLALLPGSRPSEIKANWPTMFAVADALRQTHPDLCVRVAASDVQRAAQIQSLTPTDHWSDSFALVTADASAVLDWANVALVASGTATLHALSRTTPMVVLYNVNPWAWHLAGRHLVYTRTFALPNLIGESMGLGRIVPELVPHFGKVAPVVEALEPLMGEGEARTGQRAAFAAIADRFAQRSFTHDAANALESTADERGREAVGRRIN